MKQLGRTKQTPLMTNRTHTLTVILCSVKLVETATLAAQQGNKLLIHLWTFFKRVVNFFLALCSTIVNFCFSLTESHFYFSHFSQSCLIIHQTSERGRDFFGGGVNGFVGIYCARRKVKGKTNIRSLSMVLCHHMPREQL